MHPVILGEGFPLFRHYSERTNLTFSVGTREQNPLDFSPLHVEVGTLDTGDYSLKGLDHVIRVERKSLEHLLGCVGQTRCLPGPSTRHRGLLERLGVGIVAKAQGCSSKCYRFAVGVAGHGVVRPLCWRPQESWDPCGEVALPGGKAKVSGVKSVGKRSFAY